METSLAKRDGMELHQILEFEVAFPGETPLEPLEYLKGASKQLILTVSTFFLGFKQYDSTYSNNQKFLSMFFQKENQKFAENIYNNIYQIERSGVKISIVNTFSSLKLFEMFFVRPDEPDTLSKAELERNLFKAYLVLNSNFTHTQETAFISTKSLDPSIQLSCMIFCMQYPLTDKTNFNIEESFLTQTIKAIYLFQFLSQEDSTHNLLKEFLIHFNVGTWQDYLKRLIPLAISAMHNEREAHTEIIVNPGVNFEDDCTFIDKLIIQENDKIDDNDFLTLRSTPFYKASPGIYVIIFNLFVVEKIFKGMYFFLRDVNDTLPAEKKIKSLKGFYCYEFSEKTLLYRVNEIIYPGKKISYAGQALSDMGIDGAPDYYIRKGIDILLFESKDFLIRADLKESFDYEIYDEEFAKTLYYEERPNNKEKAGAIMQLIGSIKKLLHNNFAPDTEYNYREINIYPIIITHDIQYDTPGLNELVDSWFQEELDILKQQGYYTNRIKPVTVINIDTLILHQIGLANKITLHRMIEYYHGNRKIKPGMKFSSLEKAKEFQTARLIPFAQFTSNYFRKNQIYKIPPILDLVAPELFKDEF